MGKKHSDKKKVNGKIKTALKTEKNLNAKQKKKLQAMGEEDIEKVIAEIEKEEAQRQKVIEAAVDQPSRRVNFTLTPHPFKNELIMYGGEFYDGQNTTVYGDLFFYNLSKQSWTVIKAPGAPPPRCGHQALTIPNNKGEMWMFGGEFSSPSESQFYHFRDLWVYRITEKKWEKIVASGGPSPRSGHRMVYMKKQLFIFSGFHDNLREYKYFNDLYKFDLTSYQWNKIEIYGNIPSPRSGCIFLPTPDNKLLVYGGYCKEKIKKNVDKGHIHSDMFILSPDKRDETNKKWKSAFVKQSGTKFSPRCSSTAVLIQPNIAYIFGGVYDNEDEEELRGVFFNDLLVLDIEKYYWSIVKISNKNDKSQTIQKLIGDDDDDNNINMRCSTREDKSTPVVTVINDGIFTMTIGSATETSAIVQKNQTNTVIFSPSPRINTGLVVKDNALYLYGGLYEDGDCQYTLNDFYSLDLHKLNEWHTIIKNDISSHVWLDSESSTSESYNDDSYSDDSDDNL
ncbi:kelch domain-containing protein 4 [Chelonus insularis]|uniref:kelch domain-containing protein 4 n=1 Tax=Chelonus insularis TaxID=460826 RepID=UPI0015888106|nr:kelch domain-containing protein 4 [Chelonus insularis]